MTYNNERLHSAIGYIAPADKLAGRAQVIHDERDRKLAAAREQRSERLNEPRLSTSVTYTEDARPEDKALLRSNLTAESGAKAESRAAIV